MHSHMESEWKSPDLLPLPVHQLFLQQQQKLWGWRVALKSNDPIVPWASSRISMTRLAHVPVDQKVLLDIYWKMWHIYYLEDLKIKSELCSDLIDYHQNNKQNIQIYQKILSNSWSMIMIYLPCPHLLWIIEKTNFELSFRAQEQKRNFIQEQKRNLHQERSRDQQNAIQLICMKVICFNGITGY